MPRPQKERKIGNVPAGRIREGLLSIRNGESIRKASKNVGVSFATLKRYHHKFKDAPSLEDLTSSQLEPNYSVNTIFTAEQEITLKNYLSHCALLFYGLTAEESRKLAYQCGKINNLKMPLSWEAKEMAGKDWLIAFRRRHNITLKTPEACSLARATAFNRNNVDKYFDNLENIIARSPNFSDGTRVFNLDETSTTTVQNPQKVLAPMGRKTIGKVTSGERGTSITKCCIISTSGFFLPPVMVFPRKNFKDHMIKNTPPGTLGLATPTGWMNSTIFPEVPINMTELERFKRRLIRSVARLLYKDKKAPDEVWAYLSKETGRDTKELWKRMSVLCLKKLSRLLCADDYVDRVGRVARMSLTDWLMFDMVLVHEKPDVCAADMSDSGVKLTALEDLFALVQSFQVEELIPGSHRQAETWAELALKYNELGRECSPMLLQLRWYQMKETTRSNFYRFWYKFRGNMRNLMGPDLTMPTTLQSAIAKRFPSLITSPYLTWEEMIEERSVVLFEQFKVLSSSEPSAIKKMFESGCFLPPECVVAEPQTSTSNEPDLVLLEPKIDLITVDDNSDDESPAAASEKPSTPLLTAMLENESTVPQTANLIYTIPGIKIKEEPRDDIEDEPTEIPIVDGLSNVMIVDAIHVPTEEINDTVEQPLNNQVIMNNEAETAARELENINNLDCFLNNSSALELSDDNIDCFLDSDDGKKGNAEINVASGRIDNSKAISISLNSLSPSINTPTTEIFKEADKKFDSEPDGIIKSNDSKQELGWPIIADRRVTYIPTVNPITELPSDVEIIDDGIDLCDDDDDIITFNEENYENREIKQEAINEENGKDNISDSSEEVQEAAKFDLKLMMLPVVYTTKLNHMMIFKDADYQTVKTDHIINSVIVESKPISPKAVNITPEITEETVVTTLPKDSTKNTEDKVKFEPETDESSSDSNCNIPDDIKVSINSPLFQKPRLRNYNSILLCKNPDFNTRLKRLSAGFFMSERNRQLFNVCKPLTIDLHKSFEMKLTCNKIYLKFSEVGSNDINYEEKFKETKRPSQTVSIVPSALPAQCLIDNAKTDINDLIPSPKNYEVALGNIKEEDLVAERKNKVINLPDIVKVRRINQHLLTAEVSPIQAWNSEDDEKSEKNIEKKSSVNDFHSESVKEQLSTSSCFETTNNESVVAASNNNGADSKTVVPEKSILSLEVSPLYLNEPPKAHHLQHIIPSSSRGPTVTCLNIDPVFNMEQEKTKKTAKPKKNSKPPLSRVPWYAGGTIRKPPDPEKHEIDSLLTKDALVKMLSVMGEQPSINTLKSEKPKDNDDEIIDLDKQNEADNTKSKGKKSKSRRTSTAKIESDPKNLNESQKKPTPRRRRRKQDITITETKHDIDITEKKVLSQKELDARRAYEDLLAVHLINPPKPKKVITRITNAVSIVPDSCVSLAPRKDYEINSFMKTIPPLSNISTPNYTGSFNKLTVDETAPSTHKTFCNVVETNNKIEISTQTTTINNHINLININTADHSNQQASQETENAETNKLNSSAESDYIVLSDGENDGSSIIPNYIDSLITKNREYINNTSPPKKHLLHPPPLAPINVKKKYIITCRKSLSKSCPLNLGDDHILLTTATFPHHMLNLNQIPTTHVPIDSVNDVNNVPIAQQVINTLQLPGLSLPQGVNLMLMPNGDLKAVLDEGIVVETHQLKSLLETVQRQLPCLYSSESPKIIETDTITNEISTKTTESTEIKPIADNSSDNKIEEVPNVTTLVVDGPGESLQKTIENTMPNVYKTNDTKVNDDSNTDILMSSDPTKANETSDKYICTLDNALEKEALCHPEALVNKEDVNIRSDTENQIKETTKDDSDNKLSDEAKQSVIENDKTDTKSDSREGAKKSILSDLMEMSGISSDDIQPEVQIPPAQTPFSGVPDRGSIVLTQVTSVEALKYARQQTSEFFKYNLVTGVVTRIIVTIEKRKTRSNSLRPRLINPNSVIDLTDNTKVTLLSSRGCNVLGVEGTIRKNDAGVFTLMSKKQHTVAKQVPRILRKRAEFLKRNKSVLKQARPLLQRKNRKEKIEAKIYLDDSDAPMEEEYLVDSDSDTNLPLGRTPVTGRLQLKRNMLKNVEASQSDSSDDEPLAKKVKRTRQDVQEQKQNSGPETDVEQLPIVNMYDEASQSDQNSDECILGA